MKQFAFMADLMMTVAMLGAVGGQAPLAAFIDAMDWRYAMQIIGAIGFYPRRCFLVCCARHLTRTSKKSVISSLKASRLQTV